GAKDVKNLVNLIVKKRVPAIFVESSIPQRTLKAVQEATRAQGWNVKIDGELYSDALGSTGTPAEHYIGMIEHNVAAIIRGLI
ncbi:MAG: zinc ABC transporter substrate-binding protein, partial [Candidatus Babeliales bacterium]